MKPRDRDAFVAKSLAGYIERARSGEGPAKDRYKSERRLLEILIPIQTDGFRGITLTAIMGKLVREDINTGTEFDSINPRGVFEKGIRPILQHYRIPTGASAPLNVAKNVQVLDEKWAEGRKPETAARAAVEYIRLINRHWHDPDHRDDLIMIFIQRLTRYADEVASHDVDFVPIDDVPPVALGRRLARFAVENAEGGSVPQYVVGALLNELRKNDGLFTGLVGGEASVFGTNSTSNKPADLWDILADGSFGNLYEVTCKTVDRTRLEAAYDSYAKLGLPASVITFICRVPEDCSTLSDEDGVVTHRGLPFQFVDIRQFIVVLMIVLTAAQRLTVMQVVSDFVARPSRAVKTKTAWAAAFG